MKHSDIKKGMILRLRSDYTNINGEYYYSNVIVLPITKKDLHCGIYSANTPQAIAQVLESGRYKFCFIDSLQMSKFKDNNEELWALKQRYPIGFCCISFANGAGKVRGSMEKQHQDDITITFARAGVAVTLKNRFGKVGEEFVVFE